MSEGKNGWKMFHEPFVIQEIPSDGCFSSEIKERVEVLWNRESSHYHNSKVFHVLEVQEDLIQGSFIEYKYLFAQKRDPLLQQLFYVKPLAVSGIVVTESSLLVGRRSSRTLQYPAYYETPPSGSIDTRARQKGLINPLLTLQHELTEECHIPLAFIKKIAFLGLFFDDKEMVYDLGYSIHINESDKQLVPRRTAEYSELAWFSFPEWERFLSEDRKIVPLSHQLWKQYMC